MRHFHKLTVLAKRNETDDSILLTLAVPENDTETFRYEHGQHLPLRAEIDGEGIRRTYSICSSVNDETLRLGIRVQPQGVFSNFVANEIKVGDTLEAMPPFGHFNTPLDPEAGKTYVAFVAGSGITPLLSIVKTTLETEAASQFIVFYGNRKRSTTMFIDELWNLKNRFGERLALHFIMSQEPSDIDLYSGRIDGDKLGRLHQAFLADQAVDEVFVCGPNPMIEDLVAALQRLGYDKKRIHAERFAPARRAATVVRDEVPAVEGDIEVTLVIDGKRETMAMQNDDNSILDAALRQGIDLPYSCRGGVCSTCRARLTAGEVDMALNYALEPWELERGFILTCQSKPKSDKLEVDYDQT